MDNISTLILAGALIVIMLGMGLTLQTADFKRIFLYPKAIFIGLTNQIILLPLIGLCITWVFPMQPEIAIGVMVLAACPGGPTSNLISHLAKADLALSVTLTALSSLITILTIPFIINFALEYFLGVGQVVELNILSTIVQIFIIVVIPIFIGMLVRKYRPHFADAMAKPVRIASGAVLGLIIVGLVIKERANFISYFEQAGIAAIVLNVVTMMLGYFSAKLFGIRKEGARSIAIESGIQNGTLAITIAVVLLHNAAFAIVPAVYSLLMFVTGGLVIYWFNRGGK
ncbi:putative Na+-dependent transporter [Aequorivita sublithincola DSM 14238]|uniref:Putative Na+-dependent transporter n=1 Tax=Aequorivita sublithincola (strain DSM 14238 / LMG 21431 / ACAM 643 / 9-3) TaxID=746697 RepID=I3YYG6_AEQSU|nr:bile acid:sodium symporter family protein [Aequorivita sublithincola]AFL82034.1 putative Na+-dependent transporter [Aequorivita sublithincola DSM 14238]